MNMKFLATSAAAALLLAAPAMAATFTFDNFNTDQYAADTPLIAGENSSVKPGGATSGFVGTSRTFNVANTAFSGTSERATSLRAAGGILAFNNDSGAQGSATLTYENFSLMNDASKGFFTFNVISFDGNAEFSVNGTDGAGKTITYTETLLGNFSPILRFNELAGSDVFNFYDVASLTFGISSVNTAESIDGRLSSIEVSAVPVPAAGLLLLGALGGAAALRRRKTAKKAA